MNSDGVNSYQYDHALWGKFKKKKKLPFREKVDWLIPTHKKVG